MSIFWVSIIVGLIVGYLAKSVRAQSPYGLAADLVVGVIGAFVSGYLFSYFGYPGAAGLSIGSIVVAFVGAAVFLQGLRVLTRGREPMTPETSGKLKFGVYTFLGGAVIAMIIGFAWGGWTTASTTQHKTDEAVLATRAAICVAQFMNHPNHQANLKALKETSSWERAAVIEKGGWDRMPGEKEANSTVSRACADGLDVLMSN